MPEHSIYSLRNPKFWQIALFCYWLALTVGTHLPKGGPAVPTARVDKPIHLIAYAGLAMIAAITWRLSSGRLSARHLARLWLVIVLWAAVDEWTQTLVGREPSVVDWLADSVGALIALLLFAWAQQRFDQRADSARSGFRPGQPPQ